MITCRLVFPHIQSLLCCCCFVVYSDGWTSKERTRMMETFASYTIRPAKSTCNSPETSKHHSVMLFLPSTHFLLADPTSRVLIIPENHSLSCPRVSLARGVRFLFLFLLIIRFFLPTIIIEKQRREILFSLLSLFCSSSSCRFPFQVRLNDEEHRR